MKVRQRLLRRVILLGVQAAGLIASLLPWRVGTAAGAAVGWLAWQVLPSARAQAIENLGAAFPAQSQDECARIGRGAMMNLGRSAMELLMLSRRPRRPIEKWCRFEDEDEDRLQLARTGGQGVIFVTGHTGNWELLAAVVARRGHPSKVVATPVYDPRLDQLLVAARASQGVETISRGSASAARQLLSALRRNAVLGMLIDQDTDVDGAFVPFFGRPAYTPVGAAALALRTGAAVVCGFLAREGVWRHRLVVEGPVALVRTGDHQRDVVENTALLTARIERHIREHPDQWVWFHRRWKRRPPSVEAESAAQSASDAAAAGMART